MTYYVIVFLIALLWINFVTNRIPKTGRKSIENGTKISAVITNSNHFPDHSVTLRAQDSNLRKYRVKLKQSESRLWIKGDEIDIIVSSSNPKDYRVLFNDYFRANESRIRAHAFEILEKKVRKNSIASHLVKYNREKLEIMKKSDIESGRVFIFTYLMRSIDIYSILGAIFAVFTLAAHFYKRVPLKEVIFPALLVLYVLYSVSTSVKECTKTITDAEK